jgi:predicted flap endonuclease-1-like 5' DNA nuclease
MTLDSTNLILIIVIVAGLAIMVAGLLMRGRGAKTLPRAGGESDYVASRERPYLAPPPPPAPTLAPAPPREGVGIADEAAHAATDVAGEVLGVSVERGPSGPADNLQQLKGVGPKFVARLNELGVTRFEQLAGMGANEAAHLDERMGPFQGRLARDRVIEQADYLARGDTEGFEEKFGKLGG